MKNFLFLVLGCFIASAHADISVRDDAGTTIVLKQPAKRVISLAPHVTELLFAAGGGDHIAGAVNFSDYPPAALKIPRIGSHNQLDLEQILARKPDLLVVWLHGNSAKQLDAVRHLGIPVFYSDPRKIEDIPEAIERLGQLMGTETEAKKSAIQMRQQLAALATKYRGRSPVRVFYQVWDKPLYTLNDSAIASDAIRLCGGENIFGKLPLKAPVVNIEAVLLENPEAVISGDRRNKTDNGLEQWKEFSTLQATQRGNLFTVDADLVNRATPRIVAGAAELCEKLELARSRRAK